MKTEIQVSPNRDRGYDAAVVCVSRNIELAGMHVSPTFNAPTEAKARALAEEWLKTNKPAKTQRKPAAHRSSEEDREHGKLTYVGNGYAVDSRGNYREAFWAGQP